VPTILYVIADDFGANSTVNQTVIAAREEGILTAAGLMVNGAGAEEALTRAKDIGLPLGLHANLLEGFPISPPQQIPTLLGSDGRFLGSAGRFFRLYWRGGIRRDQIALELNAQLDWLRQRGVHPIHLDSHQHVHHWHSLMDIFIEAAERFSIPRLRLASWPPEPSFAGMPRKLKYLLLCYLGGRDRRKLVSSKITVTDRLWGLDATGRLNKSYLLHVLDQLGSGSHEILCHPSTRGAEDKIRGWQCDGLSELAALTDPEVRQRIKQLGITLAG